MFLLSGSSNTKVHNCETWSVQFTFGNNKKSLEDLKWSDEGKYVIQVSKNNGAEILCVTNESVRCIQNVSVENPSAATFYRGNARNLAIGTASGKTYIWDTKSKNISKTYQSTPSAVKFLDFNAKNTVLGVALENNDVVLYGTTTNSQISTVKIPHSNTISALKFHKEYRSMIGITTDEGSILLRDLNLSKDKMFLKTVHTAPLTGMCFSPVNKDVLTSCGFDKKIQICDIRLQVVVNTIQTERCLYSIDMNTDGYIAVGTNIGEILIYDLRNYKKPVRTLKDHNSIVKHVAFQPFVSKNKKNSTFNISMKEMGDAKLNTRDSNRSSNISDVTDRSLSPVVPKIPSKDVNMSTDSFMADIINDTTASQSAVNTNVSNIKTSESKVTNFYSPNNVPASITASTPIEIGNDVLLRKPNNENVSPSPIFKSKFISAYDSNDNIDHLLFKKSIDSPSCESAGETVKGGMNYQFPPQILTNLVTELKDHIKFSVSNVLDENRKTYIHLTMQMAKHRLYLEDQICEMAQKINTLQETQDLLLEENKRLLIEIEMLRTNMT